MQAVLHADVVERAVRETYTGRVFGGGPLVAGSAAEVVDLVVLQSGSRSAGVGGGVIGLPGGQIGAASWVARAAEGAAVVARTA